MLVLACVILGCFCACTDEKKNQKSYEEGLRLLEERKYEEAYEVFKSLGDYEDSAKILSRFVYVREKATITDAYHVTTEQMYYNEDNLPIQRIVTEDDGRKDIYEYTYYSDGNLKSEVLVRSILDGYSYFYKYDAHNNLIQKTYIDYKGVEHVVKYVYDDDDRLVKEITSFGRCVAYEYDKNGNMVKSTWYDSDGYVEQVWEYIYDVHGRLIQKMRDYALNFTYFEYSYDSCGNLIKEVEHAKDVTKSKTFYVYDEASRLIKKYSKDLKGNLTALQEYAYDEQGRLISDPRYEYTYDENGNVVKTYYPDPYQPVGAECVYELRLVYIPYDLSEMAEPTVTNLVDFLGNPFMEID